VWVVGGGGVRTVDGGGSWGGLRGCGDGSKGGGVGGGGG